MRHTLLVSEYFKKPIKDDGPVSASLEGFVLVGSGFEGWKGEEAL